MPGEISCEHLQKTAYVYIRQSSAQQVFDHRESQDIQRQLARRATELGWPTDRIKVIDCDLGLSASGNSRPGFAQLLQHISANQAGALLFWGDSRLARTNQEFCQIIDLCRVFGTLAINNEGIYDPRLPGDRLFLGMKGAISEYEVHQFQALSQAAKLNKAKRGELFRSLPAGFVKNEDGQLELDPDERIRQAITTVFTRFDQLGSIGQVHKWYAAREALELPVRDTRLGKALVWRRPEYSTVRQILTNPMYAGMYVYPRTRQAPQVVDGKVKHKRCRVPIEEAVVALKDHFPGYISWAQFEKNQTVISANCLKKTQTASAARQGGGLLVGLMRCRSCGRRLSVQYYQTGGPPHYTHSYADRVKCRLSFNGSALEKTVTGQLLESVQPLGIKAAIQAEARLRQTNQQHMQSLELAVASARYKADLIDRQRGEVDPENHLVIHTLNDRWQQALEKVADVERHYQQAAQEKPPLSDDQRQRLFRLGSDLKQAWDQPDGNRLKTRIVRCLVHTVWIETHDERHLKAVVHWHGGTHTRFTFQRKGWRQRQNKQDRIDTKVLIQQLVQTSDDAQIARVLNLLKHPAETGQSWSKGAALDYRTAHNIPPFDPAEYAAKGLINLQQAAQLLGVSKSSVRRLIAAEIIKASHPAPHAPWAIERGGLDDPAIRQAVANLKNGRQFLFREHQQELAL